MVEILEETGKRRNLFGIAKIDWRLGDSLGVYRFSWVQ